MMFLPTSSEVMPTLIWREVDRRRANEPTLMESLNRLLTKEPRR